MIIKLGTHTQDISGRDIGWGHKSKLKAMIMAIDEIKCQTPFMPLIIKEIRNSFHPITTKHKQ